MADLVKYPAEVLQAVYKTNLANISFTPVRNAADCIRWAPSHRSVGTRRKLGGGDRLEDWRQGLVSMGVYVLITTSWPLCDSLVTRRCEVEGFRVSPG